VLKLKAVNYGDKKDPPAGEAAPPPSDDGEIDFFGDDKGDIEVDTSVETGEYADDGKIKNYAPRMPYNAETLPFGSEPKAARYGAAAARVVTP
jgi:hypothetical protein